MDWDARYSEKELAIEPIPIIFISRYVIELDPDLKHGEHPLKHLHMKWSQWQVEIVKDPIAPQQEFLGEKNFQNIEWI